MLDILRLFADFGITYRTTYDTQQVKIDCPICLGSYKLWVRLDSEQFFCHKCKWAPDGESFIKRLIKLSNIDTLKVYKRYQGIPTDFDNYVAIMLNKDMELCNTVHVESIAAKPVNLPDHFYLIGDENIKEITEYALSRNFDLQQLKKLNVGGCSAGKYAGYLILPVLEYGKVVFWQGREAWGRPYKVRYQTPRGSSTNFWLFNIDEAVKYDTVLICEGVFSALRAGPDAVATFGNKISNQQVQKLRDRGVRKIVICFDPDTWTVPKAQLKRNYNAKPPIVRAVERCLGRFDAVYILRLYDGDPDELGTQEFRQQLNNAKRIMHISDLSILL